METILSRIQKIASAEGITIGALERQIGASKGVLSRAINNGTDIQSKWIQIMVENYPQYSPRWLLTGRGEMLACDPPASPARSADGDGCGCAPPFIRKTNEDKPESEQTDSIPVDNSSLIAPFMQLIKEKDRTIMEQAEEIGQLRERIALMERCMKKDALDAPYFGDATAG